MVREKWFGSWASITPTQENKGSHWFIQIDTISTKDKSNMAPQQLWDQPTIRLMNWLCHIWSNGMHKSYLSYAWMKTSWQVISEGFPNNNQIYLHLSKDLGYLIEMCWICAYKGSGCLIKLPGGKQMSLTKESVK